VHLRADGDNISAHMAPAALTRVAPSGSMIVNSSRGGGGKDTWILTETSREHAGPRPDSSTEGR
jgi:carboxylate-amine ligase